MKLFEHEEWMKTFIDATDIVIKETFENTGSAEFKDILKSQHQGGKRLRPLIVAAATRLAGASQTQAPYAAAVIELLHLASLFHDDILDDTTMRRSNPTAYTQIGAAKAVLTGDYLLAELFSIAHGHLPTNVVTDLLATIKNMAKSEILSKKMIHQFTLTKTEYFQLIENKTASLFALSASMGAKLDSGSSHVAENLHEFGLHIGMAYQLTDDLEDMNGFLKDSDHDLQNGYLGFPVIELLSVIPKDQKDELVGIISHPTKENSDRLVILLNNFSIFKVTLAQIKREIESARLALNKIRNPDDSAIHFLNDLCDYLFQKAMSAVWEYEKPIFREDLPENKVIAMA